MPLRSVLPCAAAAVLAVSACAPLAETRFDLEYASGRAMRQTDASQIVLLPYEVDAHYVVLGDIHVTVRQQGAFGEAPTRAHVDQELRERAGKLGAHAVLLVQYSETGASLWSYNELRGGGRAIRFR